MNRDDDDPIGALFGTLARLPMAKKKPLFWRLFTIGMCCVSIGMPLYVIYPFM